MIKSFLRKPYCPSILLLVCFFLFSGVAFMFLGNKINNTAALDGQEATLSWAGAPALHAGAYFRAAHDDGYSPENPPLLMRCLFPSSSIMSAWGSLHQNRPDMEAVLPVDLKPLSPADAEGFRQEINLQNDMDRLAQIFAPGVPLGADHDSSLLTDYFDFGALKSGGKLMLNPKYPNYCFPVSWPFFFRDSFGDPRGEHRLHIGIDIFAEEGTEVYAMTDGVIQQLADWPRAGTTLLLAGKDGRGFIYMHLQRYAEGITAGKAVKKGELIAYVGHTGTINSPPHLHFQIHANQSFNKECAVNPYEALVTVCQGHGVTDLGQARPHFSMLRGPDQLVQASRKSPRKDYFLVVRGGPITVKTALIKNWDVKGAPADDPGLDWRVPKANWKVSRGDLKVPDDKIQAAPSSTRVTWMIPKPRPLSQPLYPSGQP
jgi:murein DD-endopeptidase MepM/ murein hydrolase activator NlpD